MIATILTERSVGSYYRFYGARHSILQLGHLIDFEVQEDNSRFMPRLRGLSHMSFPWLQERNRLALWHRFIKLFEPHLRDTESVDIFYFDLLLNAARKWQKQNPKRIICESYVELLRYEGRLHPTERCYVCEAKLNREISLMTAFKPAHPECIYAPALDRGMIEGFLESGKATYMDDTTVEQVCSVVLKGL